MCFQCVVYSALMVFMPAPQTADVVAQVNPPEPTYARVNGSKVASDTQNAIAEMLKQLPNNADMRLLREELNSLYGRLGTVKDDAQAQTLINTSLQDLSERLIDLPNYQQISQVLKSMLEVNESESAPKTLGLKLLHGKSFSPIDLNVRSKTFGWLLSAGKQ